MLVRAEVLSFSSLWASRKKRFLKKATFGERFKKHSALAATTAGTMDPRIRIRVVVYSWCSGLSVCVAPWREDWRWCRLPDSRFFPWKRNSGP